ncbi:MAG: phosphate/phosphite/phosphonate ABC transporter substrate-binding protein [Anaerolineales bacterium]|nr:phosphate/phosphite/phosphonate ABC transporter substrate-binding protein [Anaerolineales bacterium]
MIRQAQLSILSISLLTIFAAVACTASPTPTPVLTDAVTPTGVLVFGDISDEAAETINGTQPIADYLAAQLGDYGISRAEVKIAPDLDTMVQWMANGEVDLYFDSPYPALVISQKTGAEPILRRWKYGVSTYHTLFFARADAGITTVADLQGHMIAFEESFSTSGYMLPLSYLLEQGLNPVSKESPEVTVAADEIGYTFSTADNTTIQWVVSGRVVAGVVDNVTYELFVPEETRQEFVVLAETEDVPRQLVLVRPGMDADLKAAIKSGLLTMDETEEGRAVLDVFLTTEFDEFPEGADAALARMRTLYDLAQSR